ncbi:Crp/Fnr family transcriptional regulator [Azospira oryzae]|uniref:Crp/Fnr family transcriptional regulator n=1 Tax=Azospira oryzae TaxID=146939 RepID=UPI001962D7D1|nr:cyclic nucleotide-binding domain-containing protein [Azospira oryzae]
MLFHDLFRHEPNQRRITAGDFLFRAGDPGDALYVLLEGHARVLVGERAVDEVEAGAILGEMSLVERLPHSASVLAVSDCTFAAIDEKRFHILIAQTPHFATEVMRIMAHRLRATNQLLSQE